MGCTEMTDGKVVGLYGAFAPVPAVHEGVVEVLREALERAEAGDVVGVVVCRLHFDGLSSYDIAGMIGGYSLLGALGCARADVEEIVRGSD